MASDDFGGVLVEDQEQPLAPFSLIPPRNIPRSPEELAASNEEMRRQMGAIPLQLPAYQEPGYETVSPEEESQMEADANAPSVSKWSPSMWQRFRLSQAGQKLLGPTEAEKSGMVSAGEKVGLLQIPERMFEMTLPPPQIRKPAEKAMEQLARTGGPVGGVVAGLGETAMGFASPAFPLVPFASMPRMARLAAATPVTIPAFASLPESKRAYDLAVQEGDYGTAAKIFTQTAANLAVGVAAPLGAIPKAESKIPTERITPDASRIEKAAEVHGDVRPLSGEGVREVPVQESGRGVQPQAERRIQEKESEVLLNPKEYTPEGEYIFPMSDVKPEDIPLEVPETFPEEYTDSNLLDNYSRSMSEIKHRREFGEKVPEDIQQWHNTVKDEIARRGLKKSKSILREEESFQSSLRQSPSERAMTPDKSEPSPEMPPEELAQHQEVAQRLIDNTRNEGINVAIEDSPAPEYSSDVMWTSPDGVVHVNTPRLQEWIKEIGGKNLEEWMQTGLTHESIHSNSLKFLENPAEAMRDYYSNATKAEKLLAERAYYRKFGQKEIDPFQMGAEMFRRDMERLLDLKPTEVVQSKGLEWVKQKFIDLLERGIQKTRQALGTKASKAQQAILDKYQQRIDSVRKAKGWESPQAMRMEPEEARKRASAIGKMSTEEFRTSMKEIPDGLTGEAYRIGRATNTPDALEELRTLKAQYAQAARDARGAGNFDESMANASRSQFFREAEEAATGTGSAGNWLKKHDPNYVAPMAEQPALRMEPKKEKSEIQKIIEKGTFEIPKGTEKPRGTAYEAMRAVYRAAQQAGAAGKRAGEIEKASELKPVIEGLRDKISNSITKARGLAEYLRGQEKGGKLGYRVGKEEAQMVDKWLSADVENIRDSLTKLVGELPEKERGQFLPAITQALKRPELFRQGVLVGSRPMQGPLLTGQKTLGYAGGEMISPIDNMYRKAAQVAARIDNRIEGVKRENLVSDIKDFSKFKDSQKIDVNFRQQIKGTLDAFEQLEKQGGLSMDALQTIHDKLVSLRDIGRSEQNVKDAIWQWQKEFAERHLQEQPTRPVETRPELRPIPGDNTPLSMRIGNWIRNAQNKASKLDKALLPIDALFDLMEDAKALYSGWLFRHARGPIDLGYNNTIVRRNKLLSPLNNFIKNAKLTEKNAQRIGVYAQNAQEGGRQRLIDSGLSPQTIDRIVASMTPNEMTAYQMMRRAMDSQLPEVQRLMAKLYNTEVKPVDNYFPMPRDWRIFEDKPVEPTAPAGEAGYDELSSVRDLLSDYFPRQTSQTKKGFTISRQPGAKTPIKIDAFDIFRQHIQDVSHLIEMQAELKRLGELGRGDLFREKYGDVGQKMFLDWLDTVARQGGVESFKRWKLLDTMRKNSSVGIIGFRLASQLVHESNVPYMIARIGNWFSTGLRESFTERGKKFVAENFAETQERGGSEPAQVESEREGGRLFGVKVVPSSVIRASYAIARNLDRWNAQGGALGAYLRELKNKGLDWRNYDQIPIDRDAQAKALVLTRRAIASPAPKDVPQALSRGALTGGNVSVGRTLFQFQNIFLDQWSNIRHDLYQAGIREGNPKLAAQMFLAIMGATLAESGIKYGSKQAINAITGSQAKKQEEEYGKKVVQEMVRRFPFGGQLESQLMYGETGIPAIDAVTDISKATKSTFVAVHPETRARSAVKAATSVAQLAGVPGASQLGEIIYKSMPEPPKRRGQQLKPLRRQPRR